MVVGPHNLEQGFCAPLSAYYKLELSLYKYNTL